MIWIIYTVRMYAKQCARQNQENSERKHLINQSKRENLPNLANKYTQNNRPKQNLPKQTIDQRRFQFPLHCLLHFS